MTSLNDINLLMLSDEYWTCDEHICGYYTDMQTKKNMDFRIFEAQFVLLSTLILLIWEFAIVTYT